jgi:hypothetical protein
VVGFQVELSAASELFWSFWQLGSNFVCLDREPNEPAVFLLLLRLFDLNVMVAFCGVDMWYFNRANGKVT